MSRREQIRQARLAVLRKLIPRLFTKGRLGQIAIVKKLDGNEGYVARIPGYRGLLSTGLTRKQAVGKLQSVLIDWLEVALFRPRKKSN